MGGIKGRWGTMTMIGSQSPPATVGQKKSTLLVQTVEPFLYIANNVGEYCGFVIVKERRGGATYHTHLKNLALQPNPKCLDLLGGGQGRRESTLLLQDSHPHSHRDEPPPPIYQSEEHMNIQAPLLLCHDKDTCSVYKCCCVHYQSIGNVT